ncbi:MAG: peptide chain release factor 3, partial [Planctomycetaceae bacterium]
VVQYRLESEYGARATWQYMPYRIARWVTGLPDALAAIRIPSTSCTLLDEHDATVVLFESEGMLRYCSDMNPRLQFLEIPPRS